MGGILHKAGVRSFTRSEVTLHSVSSQLQAQQPVAVNHIGKDTKKESKEREKEREKERNAVMAMKLQLAGGGHL